MITPVFEFWHRTGQYVGIEFRIADAFDSVTDARSGCVHIDGCGVCDAMPSKRMGDS